MTPAVSTRLPQNTPLSAPTDSPPQATTTPVSQTGIEPAELHGARVHFWYAWTGEQAEAIESLVSEFNGLNPYGIWVESSQVSNYAGMQEMVGMALETGDPPDLVTIFIEQSQTWAKSGVDLQPYVQDPVYGLSQTEIDDYWPAVWEGGIIAGKQIGLPVSFDAAVLYYNISWARELGFDKPPETPQDFFDQVCAAGKAKMNDDTTSNDGLGGWIINTDPETLLSWILAFGGNISPDGGTSYLFNTKETNQAFVFLNDLAGEGCAWKARNPDPTGYFARREALMYSGSLDKMAEQIRANQASGALDEWTVIPYPGDRENSRVKVNGPYFEILSAQPVERLAAWVFLRWLEQPENQAQLAQAGSELPPGKSAFSSMNAGEPNQIQWEAAGELMDRAQAGFYHPHWMIARLILQDAGAQLFQSVVQPGHVEALLSEIDQTTAEVIAHQP